MHSHTRNLMFKLEFIWFILLTPTAPIISHLKREYFRNTGGPSSQKQSECSTDNRTEKSPFVNNGILGQHRYFQGKLHSSLFPSPHPSLNPVSSHLHISPSPLSSSLPPFNLSLSQHLLGLRSCLEFLHCQYYMCACESV